jgi:hypothetical protein
VSTLTGLSRLILCGLGLPLLALTSACSEADSGSYRPVTVLVANRSTPGGTEVVVNLCRSKVSAVTVERLGVEGEPITLGRGMRRGGPNHAVLETWTTHRTIAAGTQVIVRIRGDNGEVKSGGRGVELLGLIVSWPSRDAFVDDSGRVVERTSFESEAAADCPR